MNSKPIFRMYVDETGNSDLKSSNDPNHRFLSLTGIIIKIDYVEKIIYPELEKLKNKYFHSHPDDPVVLHRTDIVNKRYPFITLKKPEIENSFNEEFLRCLVNWEFKVITVLIDKKEQVEKYSNWRYDPYHYCLAVLLERYCFFLEDNNSIGDVMAESRGGKEDKRLKDSFTRLYNNGTEYFESARFNKNLTSSQLKIKNKSNNIAGLQIADIIAHPSRREMLIEHKFIQKDKEVFGDKIIEIIKSKYHTKFGKINGYGKKLLP